MPYNPILNGESGLDTRTAINNMLQELYASIATPVKLPGETANFQQSFPANTMIRGISLVALVNTPTIRIGITFNGEEIMPDTVIDESTDEVVKYYCKVATTLYFTFADAGAINVRVDVINNYY